MSMQNQTLTEYYKNMSGTQKAVAFAPVTLFIGALAYVNLAKPVSAKKVKNFNTAALVMAAGWIAARGQTMGMGYLTAKKAEEDGLLLSPTNMSPARLLVA